jgi:hypothetical protein
VIGSGKSQCPKYQNQYRDRNVPKTMKSTFTFLGAAAAAAASRARTDGLLMRFAARGASSISKSGSDNDLSLFREEAAAGGKAKEGGGVGERERTDRGEEDMAVVVVVV